MLEIKIETEENKKHVTVIIVYEVLDITMDGSSNLPVWYCCPLVNMKTTTGV